MAHPDESERELRVRDAEAADDLVAFFAALTAASRATLAALAERDRAYGEDVARERASAPRGVRRP